MSMKVVNVSLDEDTHRRLKLRSVEVGKPMSRIIEMLIADWLGGGGPMGTYEPPRTNRPIPDLSKAAQVKGKMR